MALDYETVPIRILALAVLDDARVSLRGIDVRAEIRQRFGRVVTAQQFAATAAAERRAWGTRHRKPPFLAPALDLDGSPARGWFSSSAWTLSARLVPAGFVPEAIARVDAALSGRVPDGVSERWSAAEDRAIAAIRKRPLFDVTFGRSRAAEPT